METNVLAKTTLILIILIIVQIGQYYDDPFFTPNLNVMEFESSFSMFSILLIILYSYNMQNDNLSIFLVLVILFLYLRFLYLSIRHIVMRNIRKLLDNEKIQNSKSLGSKIKKIFENTKICNLFFVFYLTLYFIQKSSNIQRDRE